MAWRSAYLRRRAPLSAPTFVAAFFYYEEPFFSTVSALIPGIFGFGQVRGGGAKDASETAMTAPSAFTASTIEWPAGAATREIEIPSRGTTVLACSNACHDTAVEGHALRADKEGYGPPWKPLSLSLTSGTFDLKKVPLTHLPASAVPGDGVVAPAHYGAAQFVEILPMSEPIMTVAHDFACTYLAGRLHE